MREILFKAKRIDNSEWVEGYLIIYPSGKCEIHKKCTEPPDILIKYDIDFETICQYTGLTDRNGQKIWENDICIVEDGTTFDDGDGYFEVGFDEDCARFTLDGDGLTVDFDNVYSNDTEVMGNIFDNPQLMEVAEYD